MNAAWVEVCGTEEIEREDVRRFDYQDRTFAVYRTSDDRYYATDGLCTHQQVHLAGGFVMGNIIECPKHNGRFDFTTGKAKGAPVCVDLGTHPVEVQHGKIYIQLA